MLVYKAKAYFKAEIKNDLCLCVRSDEVRLVRSLLDAYEQRGREPRPLRDTTNGSLITVYFGMRLITMDLDEARQRMQTSVWLRIVCETSVSLLIWHV